MQEYVQHNGYINKVERCMNQLLQEASIMFILCLYVYMTILLSKWFLDSLYKEIIRWKKIASKF